MVPQIRTTRNLIIQRSLMETSNLYRLLGVENVAMKQAPQSSEIDINLVARNSSRVTLCHLVVDRWSVFLKHAFVLSGPTTRDIHSSHRNAAIRR